MDRYVQKRLDNLTSATTKPTRTFTTPYMLFTYYSIKDSAYTGYTLLKTRYKPQTMVPAEANSAADHYQYALETNILAITGVNAGGKSQSLRLAGQMAVLGKVYDGRVPASEATIAKDIPYVFAAINTARTGEGRSTFFNEMHSVLGMYQEFVSAGCPKGALILYDEPANGTSKDEKVALYFIPWNKWVLPSSSPIMRAMFIKR